MVKSLKEELKEEEKVEHLLIREFWGLKKIKELIEELQKSIKSQKLETKKIESIINKIISKEHWENRIEYRMERAFERLISHLGATEGKLKKIVPLEKIEELDKHIKEAKIYAANLIKIMGRRGESDTALKKAKKDIFQLNKSMDLIDKAINSDQALFQEIKLFEKSTKDIIIFQRRVEKLYKKREYRPVGVAILYTYDSLGKLRFLVTQSSKASIAWNFPQGGVDLLEQKEESKSESMESNLKRELREELGINFETDLMDVRYGIHYEKLAAEKTRKDKRGFTVGKAYIYTLARYVGDGKFKLQAEEVADAKWLTYKEAIYYFNIGRKTKAELSKRALDKTMNILKKAAAA